MIRVTTSSRLHFGLLRLPKEQDSCWPDLEGNRTIPVRHFGGVGLMIDKPGVQVSVIPDTSWSAQGPLAERALEFGQRFVQALGRTDAPAFRITVERCAPEHIGLGTGTQLGLAVAKALAAVLQLPNLTASNLAQHLGRGQRSGLGIHGFEHGGFLVDGGKGTHTAIAPLVARLPFPDAWRIVLVFPEHRQGTHGEREREAFAQLACQETTPLQTDALCRLVLLGLLPALSERDLPAFGEALYDFNRRAGEMFRPWQGDIYSNDSTTSLIRKLRESGLRAVGQSSWGPIVYALAGDAEQAQSVSAWLGRHERIAPERLLVTTASNTSCNVESGALAD